MRGNSVDLTHWSVFRSREHFQSHHQWALFASKEQQTMKWKMGQSHVGKQQSFSLLDAVFSSTPVKMKFFVYWWFSQKSDSSDFSDICPKEKWVKQRPLSCQRAAQAFGGWWVASPPSQKFEASLAWGGFIVEELRSFCKTEFTCIGQSQLIEDAEPNPGESDCLRT